jgi:hypothetical protein
MNDRLGGRKKIIPPDCAGFGFVYKAHSPVHIRICAGGCNAVDDRKDKQGGGIISFLHPLVVCHEDMDKNRFSLQPMTMSESANDVNADDAKASA